MKNAILLAALPIRNADFPWLGCVTLPEGIWSRPDFGYESPKILFFFSVETLTLNQIPIYSRTCFGRAYFGQSSTWMSDAFKYFVHSTYTGWWFGTWTLFFHTVGNNTPNWLSYFSEGLFYHQGTWWDTGSPCISGKHWNPSPFFMVNCHGKSHGGIFRNQTWKYFFAHFRP